MRELAIVYIVGALIMGVIGAIVTGSNNISEWTWFNLAVGASFALVQAGARP